MNLKDFAIVILNWNGKALLEKFLPKVIAYSENAKIYVIDNASTDNSAEWLIKNHSKITLIQLTENLGYAGGYQEGLQQILEPYYCLLNSDVEVTENWLQPIQILFEKNTHIAAIQPKILDYKKRDYFEYAGAAGGLLDKFGYPYCRGRIFESIEKDTGQYDDETPIFWASGACFFIRRKDYWNVGGLDTDYFAHQEEIDLCWRLHNAGKKNFYTGKSKVYHVGGASLTYGSPKKTYLNFRNSLFSILKNHQGFSVVWVLLIRMILDGIAGLKFLLNAKFSHFFAVIKAHLSFYLKFFKMFNKRTKHPKRERTYPVKSIVYEYFIKNKRN